MSKPQAPGPADPEPPTTQPLGAPAAAASPAVDTPRTAVDPAPEAGARRFEMVLDLPAPRDVVWRALTEAREIERWFATRVVSDQRVGGRLEWNWDDHYRWIHTIEVHEPGSHLRTRYDSAVADPAGGRRPLFVDFHLEGDGGVTTLRLCHHGFGPEADFDAEYDGISGGWPAELRSLRLYLERHLGKDRRVAWARCRVALPRAEAWRRLVGVDGLNAPLLTSLREGDAFSIAVPGVSRLMGTALFVPHDREFTGRVGSHGDGWLRLSADEWGGATNVWLWLALYSQPEPVVAACQSAFEALLRRVFSDPAPASATS